MASSFPQYHIELKRNAIMFGLSMSDSEYLSKYADYFNMFKLLFVNTQFNAIRF